MTIKLVKMDTKDDLLLPTHSCDLLIFWSCDNQNAEVFKGAFPENLNIFEVENTTT